MDPLHAVLRVYKSEDPASAFQALVDSLSTTLPLHCAVWVGPDHCTIRCAHPTDAQLPPELLNMAGYASRPEVFPLGSLSPVALARYPASEMLFLPLPGGSASVGALILVADEDAFGDGLEGWEAVGEALGSVAERARALDELREEREVLRKRAQEMEALDVLGLAANRTLDPAAVLNLVARFTRTLLGAHYAIVHTMEDGEIRASASVGLKGDGGQGDGNAIARRVIAQGKPIVSGDGGDPRSGAEPGPGETQGTRVELGVPLALFGETFGALVVGYRDPYPVTSRDTLLALTLARHAAVAINNAKLHSELAVRSTELERAYDELEHVSRLKERFFASMSHELRTPLNGILGYQNLLLEGIAGEVSEMGRAYLEKANRAAQNLLLLVNDILDYAKIEAGKMTFLIRPVPLAELLSDALANVEPLIARKGLRLSAPRPAAGEPVHTDPDRVRQILVNLLSNAIKFTEAGEIALEVVDGRAGGAGDGVEIRVRDSGPGIPPSDHEKIFQEFEQVEGTKGGTGLGLPISRKLARLLGGDLSVQSEAGSGSTFILRLADRAPEGSAVRLSSDAA